MQRLSREAYLIILAVILLVSGALAFRTAQVKNSDSGTEDTGNPAFAEARYPYRQLSRREQKLYEALYNGIAGYQTIVHLPDTYTDKEYERIYLMVMMQEPDFFYVDRVYELAAEMRDVKIYYTMTQEEAGQMRLRLESAADSVLQQLSPTQTSWQQLLTVHDVLAQRCRYGQSLHSDDVCGLMTEGWAMCEGYSKAFLYVARRAGFEAMCVPGRTGNGSDHVWNIVQIDGQYYNMDLTFDDDDCYGGSFSHACFAVSDTFFSADHLPDRFSYSPPPCTDSTQTYYIIKALQISEPAQLVQRVQEWMNRSVNSVTEFYCSETVTDPKSRLRSMLGGTGRQIYWDEVRRIAVIV